MTLYVGLDASLNETAICVVDQDGQVIREQKAASEPDAIAAALLPFRPQLRLLGVEACAIGGWLQAELTKLGFEIVVIETHHTHVSLSTMRNKTDRNDARGIAQLMRLGWFKVVHVKSAEAQHMRSILGVRKLIVRKLVDTENEIRGMLRGFGLKVGPISRGNFAGRVCHLTEDADVVIQELAIRLLAVRDA
ncbi:Transposase, partial [Pseudoxanthomonas sp. GM95]|uniref:IS110 family transposase n=1 Tax=Pseudoxanthomonas sp. GM95 TaxID=1881043 RepID=UPI0008D2B25C